MAAPDLVPLLMEMLKWGVQGFKVGKTIEGAFDTTVEQMKQSAQQRAQQPPPPDPRMEAEKMKAQALQQKMQNDQQLAGVQMQTEGVRAQAEQTKAQASIMVSQNKMREAEIKAMTPQPV